MPFSNRAFVPIFISSQEQSSEQKKKKQNKNKNKKNPWATKQETIFHDN